MDVFETQAAIVRDYLDYVKSFLYIQDDRIREVVDSELTANRLCPEPLIQFNPAYEVGESVSDLCKAGILHADMDKIFSGYDLYKHQVEAIKLGFQGRDFVVTSGTGSGKSLTYLGTIFNHILRSESAGGGIRAVIVYPMNALINSQNDEITKYKSKYETNTGKEFPITFAQYTGQENEEERERIRTELPDIILTNYMMLELILTRIQERGLRDAIYQNLRYLVFDELHTYRGRQGSDVALLIRRIRAMTSHPVTCIGTSATMIASEENLDQREKVAEVAARIFGKSFEKEQVVNEYLGRSLQFGGQLPARSELARALSDGIDLDASEQELQASPLAIWLENKVALIEKQGRLVRNKPQPLASLVAELARDVGRPEGECRDQLLLLLKWLANVNAKISDRRRNYLPFKIHQFISQSGAVYVTLEQDEHRVITLEPGVLRTDNDLTRPLFPIVFSRTSGHEFVCVTKNYENNRLEPREFREPGGDGEDGAAGYIVFGENIWRPEDLEQLPEAWVKVRKNGTLRVEKKYRDRIPRKIFFDETGNFSDESPLKWQGWFMPWPLLFDPTSGTIFDPRTKENTKLTRLGSEGRSTSTTVLSLTVLKHLAEAGYQAPDQKVLSFTDNRQDASLQAGHFNDFIEVIRLRSGITHALSSGSSHVLDHSNLAQAIFDALGLPILEYANLDEEPTFPSVRQDYENAFKDYLMYRALYDLRRGWRVILPNLEQCALLEIDYKNLSENCAHEPAWKDVPLLNLLSADERTEVVYQILDYFRKSYALYSESYLSPQVIEQKRKIIDEKLKLPWKFDDQEKIQKPFYLRYETLKPGSRIYHASLGSSSALGKYLRSVAGEHQLTIKGADYKSFIRGLLDLFCQAGWLKSQPARNAHNEDTKIYQLRIDQIVWRLGDGTRMIPDPVKNRSYKTSERKPNLFFQALYKTDFKSLKKIEGREHTAQLNNEDRQEREHRFKSGEISCLFCSPTMELGIDIANLNVVHMRNAPPNPANYAQRSGRAGRSGQAALVFTYCSNYSPHDRHYFKNATKMVAGEVAPARIDLVNEELLTSHLNAIYLSLCGLNELDHSIAQLVDESDQKNLPLKQVIREKLKPAEATRREAKRIFSKAIADFAAVELQSKAWFTENWLEHNLDGIISKLDRALLRWRNLYQSALSQLAEARAVIDSGLYTNVSTEMEDAKRKQRQGLAQRGLLKNERGARNNQLSEFYPYRYLASEGFLPGYNFTRLPIRTFIPIGDSGQYISRGRFIALREFGPRNVIYHNGAKYQIEQLITPDAAQHLKKAKVSKNSGYFLIDDEYGYELCPFTKVPLRDDKSRDVYTDLLEMSETRCQQTDRISCEEEERLSRGFDMEIYFRVPGGLDRIIKGRIKNDEADFLNLRFIPAAQLVQVNRKWLSSRENGFNMGLTSGRWKRDSEQTSEAEENRRIMLYTTDTADALHIEPIKALGLSRAGVITLQYALKRAIENIFQVEPREIGVNLMGDDEHPNIFIYEATEGSLGILSQFVEDKTLFGKVVEQAYRICRFDEADYKEPASYDDLLSYYNQRHHLAIDRFKIKDALEKLKTCTPEILTSSRFRGYDEHYESILKQIDPQSSTEREFLDYLYQNGLRLPDKAQERVSGIYSQPDFFYEPDIWVFCDGTPHDRPEIRARDEKTRNAIRNRGEQVIVYYYKDKLQDLVAKRSDVFRKVR